MSRIALNSVAVTLLNACAQLASFVLFAAIAALFGADLQTDAFFLALTIAGLLINPVVNSIASVFIPVLTECRIQQPEALGRLTGSALAFVVVGSVVVTLAIGLAAPLVLSTVGGVLPLRLITLATEQLRFLLPMIVLQTVAAALAAIYNSHGHFRLAAGAAGARYLATLGLVVALRPSLGIISLPVSFVLGSVVNVGVLIACWRRLRAPLEWGVLKSYHLRRLLGLSLPLTAGNVGLQLGVIVTRLLAAGLAAGSVSVLDYATRISSAVMELITSGVFLVTLADWSEVAARGDAVGLRDRLRRTMLALLFVILPIVAVFLALREPLIAVLLQRGRFDPALTPVTAAVLGLLLLGLPADVVGRTYVRLLLVWQDTWALTRLAAIRLMATALFAVGLGNLLQVRGLALAETLAVFVVTVGLVVRVNRQLGNTLAGLGIPMGKLAATAFAAWLVAATAGSAMAGLSPWIALPAAATVGGLSYLAVAWLFQSRELMTVLRLIGTR